MSEAINKPVLSCLKCDYLGDDYDLKEVPPHMGAYCPKCFKLIKWLSKGDKYATKEQELEIWEKTKGLCFYCGCRLNPLIKNQYTVEHIISRNNGGSNKVKNLAPCCQSCNSAKGGKKDINEFRAHLMKRDNLPYYIFYFEVLLYAPKSIKDILKAIYG